MKFVSVVGARPQFIKLSPMVRAFEASSSPVNHVIVHTGQHYDYEMSQVFFESLGLPQPDHHLEIGSGSHGSQTGRMMEAIENVLLSERPDMVMVYGDTNTTLAGAIASSKLHIRTAHVEAGLRSFNRLMPEETNRVITDHISDILFCPSRTAVKYLQNEGIDNVVDMKSVGPRVKFPVVYNVGDVMYDVFLLALGVSEGESDVLARLNLEPKDYYLSTIHRTENVDNPDRLRIIFEALADISVYRKVVIPMHPRTKNIVSQDKSGLDTLVSKLQVTSPLDYFDMLCLGKNACTIITDSGGVQKEAYWLGVPCVTLREETEWPETVDEGANLLVGVDYDLIVESVTKTKSILHDKDIYGDGNASKKIVKTLIGLG